MRINTKSVYEFDGERYVLVESEGYEYDGPVALAGGGGSTKTTTNTIAEPPKYLIPHLQDQASAASSLFRNNAPQYYPFPEAIPFSNQSQQALGLQEQRALSGSPVTGAAQDLALGNLRGDFLNSNPYFDQTVNTALRGVQDRINSQFEGSGRFGSGYHTDTLGRALGDVSANLYGQNYENERNRQMQSLLFAPQLANQDYFDIAQLGSVGQAIEGKAGEYLGADVNRFNYNQNLPWAQLQRYTAALSGQPGGFGTTTQTGQQPGGSRLAGALGGGLTGAAIGSSLPFLGGGAGAGLAALGPAGIALGLGGALAGGK